MMSHPFRSGRKAGTFFACFLSIALLGLALTPMATVEAGGDDFEFGQNLVQEGRKTADPYWFDLARQVFERMLNDRRASAERKDEARYGLATLAQGEAEAAQNKTEVPYGEVKKLYDTAIKDIESFVKRNPQHPKATEAANLAGVLRLAFVQWARDVLLVDKDLMKERQTDGATVQADAKEFVEAALNYFESRRKGWDTATNNDNALAQYYWTVCQYYRALVQDRCSQPAASALENAADKLEDFIGFFDGNTVALYAQDFYGLTRQEQANCAETEDERESFYGKALMWFVTCIDAPALGPDTLKIIARGYYHIGQMGMQAGRVGDSNFYRQTVAKLRTMLSRTPLVAKYDDGLRAMFEWAKLEHKLERTEEAIRITSEAATRAKRAGKGYLEFEANRLLKTFVSGGNAVGGDPEVLLRVADGEFAAERWSDAISAYQGVLRSVGGTNEAFRQYAVPAWTKMASAYKKMGDLLGYALALEPLHEAWVDGRVEQTRQAEDEFGNYRQRAALTYGDLYEQTSAATFRDRQKEIERGFPADYPNHISTKGQIWKIARDAWTAMREARKTNDRSWKQKLEAAVKLMEERTKDDGKQWQHSAFSKVVEAADLIENWQDVLSRANRALDFWDSAAAKKAVKEDPKVAQLVMVNKGRVIYWKGKAEFELKQPKKTLETLENYGARFADLQEYFLSGAQGYLVLAQLELDNIDAADAALRVLIRKYPTNAKLPKITFQLAQFYQDKWQTLAKEYSQYVTEKQGDGKDNEGLTKRIASLDKQQVNIELGLGTLRGKKSTLERLIKTYEEAQRDGLETNVTQTMYEDAKKDLASVNKTIATRTDTLRKVKADVQSAEARLVEVEENIARLKPLMYEPLKKAADYYKDWDDVLIANKITRSASNVKLFADNYERLTKLRPEVPENWAIAQRLYEDYLDLARKDSDERSDVLSSLGRVYSFRARQEEDEKKKAVLVSKAIEFLQNSFPKVPENSDLVLGIIEGKYAILPYTSTVDNRKYRFAVPTSIKTVAELRKAVNEIGTPGGAPLPVFEQDLETRRYKDAARSFVSHVKSKSDAYLTPTAKAIAKAAIDTNMLSLLANTRRGFRIALSRGYSESNNPEHALRGIKLVGTLLSGNLEVPESSGPWWEAQTILVRATLNYAEAQLKGGKDASAEAKGYLDDASRRIVSIHGADPAFGESLVEGNQAEMKQLVERLNVLRQRAGLGIFRLPTD